MFQYDEKGVENMLLRIAVCDDEAIHRLIIRDKLDAYAISNDIDYELDEFTNSKELMKMENIYDILFLDVQLEDGMNGIEVGKRLLQKGIDATIIITTSFEQYASEGYHLKAHRYLIKPIQQSNFNEAIVSCIKDFKKSNRKIEVKCAYENCFIKIKNSIFQNSLIFQGLPPVKYPNLMYFPLFLPLPAETREFFTPRPQPYPRALLKCASLLW